MGAKSSIEWTDATWPVVQGCDPVSPGCVNCYAVPLLWRMAHNPNEKISGPLQGVTEQHVNRAGETILRFTGKLALREDRLTWPLQWKKSCMIFVPSHGDIFHKDVPDSFLDKIFAAMVQAHWHTYQVLTKRSERMHKYINDPATPSRINAAMDAIAGGFCDNDAVLEDYGWPLPNVWLGVSAERQQEADERIPHLLQTPAAIRFVSLEPLLGPIDLRAIKLPSGAMVDALSSRRDGVYVASPALLDWIIVGGESGPSARPMNPAWVWSLREQCRIAGSALFFFKQWGAYKPINDARTGAFIGSIRLGKKAAGRLLDGHEYNGMPEVHHA